MIKYFFLIAFVMMPVVAPAWADSEEKPRLTREEKQELAENRAEATAWVKDTQATGKKLISVMKRIRSERTAKKFASELESLVGASSGRSAMGEAAPAELPDEEALALAVQKQVARMKKLHSALAEEHERLSALDLDCLIEALSRVQSLMDDIDTALEAAASLVPVDEEDDKPKKKKRKK